MEYHPEPVQQLILCCSCGIAIPPNPANMCENCIRNEVDITEGIPKQGTIQFCRNCGRYLQPPNYWLSCELESRELLALCVRKLRGLNKVRLIDAGFIWTEPHSRRIKVKLTIQKEVFANTILQQQFQVEFTVANQQCDDCDRVMAKNTWKAVVQVRQKVSHKRTFLYLEQLILKHRAFKNTTNIKEVRDGIDFYFAQRNHAIKMVEFFQAVVPVRSKSSERLISTDIRNNTSNYKFTYSVEIMPICREDLVCLPVKLARSLGNIHPLVLCHRVGNTVSILDPNTLDAAEIQSAAYWNSPFSPLMNSRELTEFYVLDVEPLGPTRGKLMLADVTVARASDLGTNDTTFLVRSHLGHLLNPGDHCLGYDLTTCNFNNDHFDQLDAGRIPDVVIVKKHYPGRRKKTKRRTWKLKSLTKEQDELVARKQDLKRIEQDYELFLRDLEEDPELRANINLYKADDAQSVMTDGGTDMDETEADFPEVQLHELMNELDINDESDDAMQ
ncbi:ribosome-binding protein [Dimargaris xerosporica]|nr:ribosome-binding protein [Dimargaris xerosporica]